MDKKNKFFDNLAQEAEKFNFYGDSSIKPKTFGGIGAIMPKKNKITKKKPKAKVVGQSSFWNIIWGEKDVSVLGPKTVKIYAKRK